MFQLAPGDVLVTFTDGLHDAINMEGRRSAARALRRTLVEVLRQEPGARPGRIVDHVRRVAPASHGLTGCTDDITLIVMRVGDRAGSGQHGRRDLIDAPDRPTT